MRRWILGLAVAGVVAYTSGASAQVEAFSLDAYLQMQQRADATFEAFVSMDEADLEWGAAGEQALEERLATLNYLGRWSRSGTMPDDMVAPANEARLLLYQNIVAIHTLMGACDEAESATARLAEHAEELGGSLAVQQAVEASWADVGRCRHAEAVAADTTDPVEAETETETTAEPGESSGSEQAAGNPVPVEPEDTAPEPLPNEVEEPVPSEAQAGHTTEWLLAGIGTALLAGGTYVAVVELPKANEEIDTAASPSLAEDAQRAAREVNYLASGLVGVGGALVATGLAMRFLGGREAGAPEVSWIPLSGGGLIDLRWQW